jgi:hypothetical protein
MLWTILTCLWWVSSVVKAQCDATPPANVQPGTNNHVVDYFAPAGVLFAYGINQCTETSLIPTGKYYKYVCSEEGGEWMVTKSEYTEEDCSGSATEVETWGEGDSSLGLQGYFVCDGEDTYAKVLISAFEDCGITATVYGGIGACLLNDPLYTNFYCDDEGATIQFFLNSSFAEDMTTSSPNAYCEPNLFCTTWDFSTEGCAEIGTVNGDTPIYGSMAECKQATAGSSSSTSTPSSAYVSFSIVNIIFALVLSLFWLF